LLRVRERREDLRAQALAETRREIHVNERQRDEIIDRQRRTLEEAGAAAQHEFDARDVRQYYVYERHLARLAVEKDANLAQLRSTEETRRIELEDAMKERRIVERLKERLNDAFTAEVVKEEQKTTDETATNHAAIARGRSRDRAKESGPTPE
jgi:flagellar export protein FliJ